MCLNISFDLLIGDKWICCDDLKGSESSWSPTAPQIPPQQIHIIMWEKQGITPDASRAQQQQFLESVENEIPLLFGKFTA